jgi:hypothetical protein
MVDGGAEETTLEEGHSGGFVVEAPFLVGTLIIVDRLFNIVPADKSCCICNPLGRVTCAALLLHIEKGKRVSPRKNKK